MVSVPITNGSARATEQRSGNRLNYSEGRDLVGGAVAAFGSQVSRAADTWDAIEATYDEADAARALNKFREFKRETLQTGEGAYLQTQGFNAGEQRSNVVSSLETKYEELVAAGRSKRAQEMARRALSEQLGTAKEAVFGHEFKEMAAARDQESAAIIEGAQTDAIDARGTEQFAVQMGVLQMELGQMAERKGWSDEELRDKSQELVSATYARTILAIDAEDGEPTRAMEFLEKNKAIVGPEEEARLRNALTPRVDQAWATGLLSSGALDSFYEEREIAQLPEVTTEQVAAIKLQTPFAGKAVTVAGGKWQAKRDYGGHSGVDYAGLPAGTPVIPTSAGVVIKSGFVKGYGNRVEVSHGKDANGRDIVTTYSHLADRNVKVGQKVDTNTKLGGVGSTGGNYGTHLHYEVMVGGKKVNPDSVGDIKVSNTTTVDAGAPGVVGDPRLNSKDTREAILRFIESEEKAGRKIPERRQQVLLGEADRFVANARSDREQAEREVDRSLQAWLTNNKPGPDDLMSIADIPAALISGASPSTLASLSDRVQATQTRIEARYNAAAQQRANEIEARASLELYKKTDEELLATDLWKLDGIISEGALGPWYSRQNNLKKEAQNKTASEGKIVGADFIASNLDQIGEPYGIARGPEATEEQKASWVKMRRYLEERIGGLAEKEVTKEQIIGIIGSGMAKVQIEGTGWFGSNAGNKTVARAELPSGAKVDLDDMPQDKVIEIRRSLKAAGVANPPNVLIWTTYQEGLARGLY